MGMDIESYRWKFWKRIGKLCHDCYPLELVLRWIKWISSKKKYGFWDMIYQPRFRLFDWINQQQYLGIGYTGAWKISPMWDKTFDHSILVNHDYTTLDRIYELMNSDFYKQCIIQFKKQSRKNKYLEFYA